ncbi:MAG TPA: PQQ-dependent sugar dehydrogenase [Acidimicrobiales bacterium]|nr:PQQ-dependent sugar dehydrogenase [Acidimicrobiales bacterium]
MQNENATVLTMRLLVVLAISGLLTVATPPAAVAAGPALADGALEVRTVVSGLTSPTTMAFLGPDDFLVLERVTGRVQRVVGGAVHSTALDLAVNFASERGLLGIALHPGFPATPKVYLFWTESSTGSDTGLVAGTPLLGNRVDAFVWDGASLTFDQSIIRLRAVQGDAGQPERGNNNGGVVRFGPDGKLYVFVGDVGRRGLLQNLACGPTNRYDCPPGAPVADDAFGGPMPDNAHLTGVVLRLNDDGSTPSDNPFFSAGAAMGGEVGANIQRVFSYGHRNSFGMDFDPATGALWLQENGDDSFSELNRVLPGMNGGWVQVMGPASRIGDYKAIETTAPPVGLQQDRWPPTDIADTPAEAMARLFMLPGAHYADPKLSWKYEVAAGGIGFVRGTGLGVEYDGALVMGGARDLLEEGHLFLVRLGADRLDVAVDDPRLADGVADNVAKWDITESESLRFGSGFGVVTDVRTGPDGDLYVVSLSHGAVYAIGQRFGPPPFTRTITGDHLGPVTVNAGESVLITTARVVGPVTVNTGGALTVVDSKITRGITADGPSFFSVCGTDVSGPAPAMALSITNAGAPVQIGDPAAGCAGNRFAGPVRVAGNRAVTFGANTVTHNATIEGNGPGSTVIKANDVFGTLACSGNNPAPTDAGQSNTAGAKTGQCTAL